MIREREEGDGTSAVFAIQAHIPTKRDHCPRDRRMNILARNDANNRHTYVRIWILSTFPRYYLFFGGIPLGNNRDTI